MSDTRTRTQTQGDETEHGVTADLALAAVMPKPIATDAVSAFVVPRGASLLTVDAEALADSPARARGEVRPGTVDALVAYCVAHNEQATEVWVSTDRIVAVLNGRHDNETLMGWGDHRAALALAHTPEWLHWMKLDGRMVSQAEFAEHIEEGLIDIVEPASADMLEIAQHFHVSRAATFRSSQHLQSGRIGFVYDEEDAARAGQAKDFEIPKEFKIGIPVYDGEEAYRITARFRYRLTEGHLTLGYKLERPDVVKRDAAQQIAERLRAHDGAFAHVYDGAPGAAVASGRLKVANG
jgi:uncharacterized protein YfdQ (DUF2303 family)